MKKMMFFSMLWVLTMGSSCRKEEVGSAIPIQFKLRLLNALGSESTQFNEGENFKLSLLLTNPTDSVWAIRNKAIKSDDFFRVYDDVGKNIGKPFTEALCSTEPVGGTIEIPAKGSFELSIPWVVKDSTSYKYFCGPVKQSLLKKGNYKTGFRSSFEFLKGKTISTDTLIFNLNFSII